MKQHRSNLAFWQYRRILVFSLLATLTLQMGCRHRSRSSDLIGQAPTVSVKLLDIRQEDRAHPNFIYEAHGCGQEPVTVGTIETDTKDKDYVNVSFAIKGVKVGDSCRIDVRLPNTEAFEHKIRFTERELLMYQAQESLIRTDIYGKFIATANLKRTYYFNVPDPTQRLFEVQVPIEFPEAQSQEANLDGHITCTPSLKPVDSKIRLTDGNKAELILDSLFVEGQENRYECRRINVSVNNKPTYFVRLSDSSMVSFSAKPDETVVFSQTPIKLVRLEPPIVEGIIVDTESSECPERLFDTVLRECKCPEGQVFDSVRRECIDESE